MPIVTLLRVRFVHLLGGCLQCGTVVSEQALSWMGVRFFNCATVTPELGFLLLYVLCVLCMLHSGLCALCMVHVRFVMYVRNDTFRRCCCLAAYAIGAQRRG